MNEKRFEVDIDHLLLVWDTEKNKRLEIEDIVDLLNEQQATIERLQDLCGESDYENAKLRLKNKELQDKIDWLCEKYDYPKQELSETHYESKNYESKINY